MACCDDLTVTRLRFCDGAMAWRFISDIVWCYDSETFLWRESQWGVDTMMGLLDSVTMYCSVMVWHCGMKAWLRDNIKYDGVTLWKYENFIVWQCDIVIVWHCDNMKVWLCDSVTLRWCDIVMVWHCHGVTLWCWQLDTVTVKW